MAAGFYCTVCCMLGCSIGALCIAVKYHILLLCVACWAEVLYCTVCFMLGCNIGALCIPGKYCILLLCVACLVSVLYCTVCSMLTCCIVLHCVLHVGLQYWSIMHSWGNISAISVENCGSLWLCCPCCLFCCHCCHCYHNHCHHSETFLGTPKCNFSHLCWKLCII